MASAKGIRAGLAYVELVLKDDLAKGLAGASKKLKAFGTGVTDLGKKLVKLGGLVTAPLLAAAKSVSSAGDALVHMSERTGIAVEELSLLNKAASLSGVEDLQRGLTRMQRSLTDAATGTRSAKDALDLLKLSATDLLKLSPDKQFKLIGDRLSKIQNPTLRAALAMEIFGRSGATILPMFADGAAGLEEMEKYLRSLGLYMTQDAAEGAHRFSIMLEVLGMVMKRLLNTAGIALLPTLSAVGQRLITLAAKASDWIKANQGLVVTVFKVAAAVTGAGLALIVLGKGIGMLAAVVHGASVACTVLAGTVGMIGSVLGAVMTPLGGVIVLLGGLAAYLIYATGAGAKLLDWLGEKFGELRDTAVKAFQGISDAMAAGNLALAAKILWLGLKIAWQVGTGELQKVWLTFAGFFEKVAYGAFYGVLAAGEFIWHGLKTAWIEGVAFIKNLWTDLKGLVLAANEEMVNGFVKAWIWAKSKTDPNFDASFAYDYAAKQHNSERGRIDQEKRAAMAGIEQQRAAAADAEARRHDQRLAAVGQAYNDAAAAVDSENAAKIQQAKTELQKAKSDLAAATAEAARQRQQLDASGKPMPKIGAAPGTDEEYASLADLLAQSAKRTIGVAGTFNAAEARGLGSGSAADRIASATEATARNTRKLVDKLRGQAVFD